MHLPPFQLSAEGELRSSSRGPASLQDMGLLALYGRVYCYLHCRAASAVKLYRFYKCAAAPERGSEQGVGFWGHSPRRLVSWEMQKDRAPDVWA